MEDWLIEAVSLLFSLLDTVLVNAAIQDIVVNQCLIHSFRSTLRLFLVFFFYLVLEVNSKNDNCKNKKEIFLVHLMVKDKVCKIGRAHV